MSEVRGTVNRGTTERSPKMEVGGGPAESLGRPLRTDTGAFYWLTGSLSLLLRAERERELSVKGGGHFLG